MLILFGKFDLVTGGARVIGAAAMKRHVQERTKVVVLYSQESMLEEILKEYLKLKDTCLVQIFNLYIKTGI